MSAVASAGNTYSQYNATLGQGRFQRSIYNQNAALAEQQAQTATDRGNFEAGIRGIQTSQTIGRQRAYSSDGVDVNTGSAAKAQEATAAAGAVDQATIRQNAALQSWGYRMEGIGYRTSGRMAQIGARSSANSSLISGGLGFARDVMAGGYYAGKAGMFDKTTPDMVDQAGFGYWGK